MKTLSIASTPETPGVHFDSQNNIFEIRGKSVPDDAENFYAPILEWFDLEYFNISSSKRLLFLLYKLNDLNMEKGGARIKWMYNQDDEDMFEVGQDYAFMVKIPFDFVSYATQKVSLVS